MLDTVDDTITIAPPFTFEARHFSKHAYNLESSIIRDILKFSNQPGVISFAGGLPAPELFPVEQLREAADRVLRKHGTQAFAVFAIWSVPTLRWWQEGD